MNWWHWWTDKEELFHKQKLTTATSDDYLYNTNLGGPPSRIFAGFKARTDFDDYTYNSSSLAIGQWIQKKQECWFYAGQTC